MELGRWIGATLGACLLAGGAAVLRADDVPPPTAASREVAADGTVSVVVEPPQAPPAARPPARAEADRAAPTAAAELLDELLGTPVETAASNSGERPLPLLEALERSGDRTRRLWITQAYWKVAACGARVRQAAAAIDRLDLVAPGAAQQDRVVLDALVAERRSERAAARAALVAAQQELVDLVRLPVGDPLPRPVDRPLVTPYQTHFETIFANRMATGRVRAIHRMLPARHEAIEAGADGVRAAAEAFALAEAHHAQGRLPIEAVATAAERLETQERRFIEDVRVYNAEIAEYVMAVADFSVPDDRFAAMLIGAPTPWRQPPVVIAAGATGDAASIAPIQPLQAPVAGASAVPVPPPPFVPQTPLQPVPPLPSAP